MVVLFHAADRIGVWSPCFGYLAVDLFFLLSGFVLEFAYGRRFRDGMKASEFLVARVVRLYPLYLLGLMLGGCVALLNLDIPDLSLNDVAMGVGLGLFGLPTRTPHTPLLFFINLPAWSLFFEFWIANVIFALFNRSLGWKALFGIILTCAAGIVRTELVHHFLGVGPTWNGFLPGFFRVGFSFFSGVALARVYSISPPKTKLPSWIFVVALPVLLSLPLNGRIADVYVLACVMIIFPAIIYWGAEAIEQNPRLGAALGDASYAVYTIHFPFWVLASWTMSKLAIGPSLYAQLIFALAIFPLAWGLSFADTWLRAAFTKQFENGRASAHDRWVVN